jgi:hypothetical protein
MAGHSKWWKVKRFKGAIDAQAFQGRDRRETRQDLQQIIKGNHHRGKARRGRSEWQSAFAQRDSGGPRTEHAQR